ncbi:unnamed protein product [Arabis nemorensis]|uniref:Uncharacterized protein n=1 Tax=Arabis nemorensis TaxID=586526 RepID=A0A565BHW2_9BRAS|nr:unnamed protein product [Arabis nemorensis]
MKKQLMKLTRRYLYPSMQSSTQMSVKETLRYAIKPGTTEAEFQVVIQVATKSFWLFCNLAFPFALAAALVQVGKHSRISLKLVMVALLCMWLSVNCVAVVRLSPFLHCFRVSSTSVKDCFFC